MGLEDNLRIWQQNVNKSPSCQHDLLSYNKLIRENIHIVALQEPAVNAFNCTIASRDWTPVYPTTHMDAPTKTRSITLVNAQISTDNWNQLDFPSGDVTVIQFNGDWGKLILLNIYNDGNKNDTINALIKFHRDTISPLSREEADRTHMVWLGDFNRHHPHWDDPNDTRLFTREALRDAETLIEALAEAGLEFALPRGIPTHIHCVTKKWSRLDQVFISEHSTDLVILCDTQVNSRGINTDHLPILTELNLAATTCTVESHSNFRDVDWEEFNKALEGHLKDIPPAAQIKTQRQLDQCCTGLTKAIQRTISEKVPTTDPVSKSKRWWTKELTQLRSRANKLGRLSHARRNEPEHTIHAEHKEASREYDKTLQYNKKQHWRDWLERAEEPDLWTMHRITSALATDGGKARIPTLKHIVEGQETFARTNDDKSTALAKGFFPPKPEEDHTLTGYEYPRQCEPAGKITAEQIQNQIRKLKPFKAPGPDGIPNIVLMKCAQQLTDRLLRIYEATFEHNLFFEPWKHFTTVVLRKPGKPRYDVPKAYRPIALLNTMWKVLTAIIAEHLTYVTETHQLLPENHFGGRPGRTTTDAMHLLAHRIKASWRSRKVTSVLFLDVEGAFPNAVPSRLEHNLRKRRVPRKIVNFVHSMLRGRQTALRFDGFTSGTITIDNGIGQGDPLSMMIYQYYNADLLDIPREKGEEAIAYVDDGILIATANTFLEAHGLLSDMMTRDGGVTNWSRDHNSPLEYSKLALVDFAHASKEEERVPLHLPQITVQPSESAKYLGVIFDQHLNWKVQHAHAIGKGTKWSLQIRRLTRPSWGITPSHARKLYIGVAIPKTLYAADIWCNPSQVGESSRKWKASIIRQLTTIQRAGTLAITGGLRTSPTDALDAVAFMLPLKSAVDKWCHRAMTRLATLPCTHPLHRIIARKSTGKTRKHKSPLNSLVSAYNLDTIRIGKLPSAARHPTQAGKLPFKICVPESRTTSVEAAENATEEIQVYTDGSAINGKVGAAAVLIRAGTVQRTLHLHIGDESEHTVHEVELVGILLGLHLISTERKGSTSFLLGVDNQAAIKAFQLDLRKPGQHLAKESIRVARRIHKHRRKGKYSLTLQWTAGHEGIAGNELVDQEAKLAAEGKTSEKHSLPVYLRKPLTANPAAIKKQFHERLKKNWEEDWRSSSRGKLAHKLDNTTPSKKFVKSISKEGIGRNAASRIAQFRLKHAPLNQYLKRIGKVDSAQCPACGENEETIEHYLLTCPNYAHERWALTQKAKKLRKQLTLETLLGDKNMIAPLANFIEATHRFSKPGE